MANTDNEGPVVSESFPKEGHASNHISAGPVLTEDSSSIQDVSASKSPANPSPEPPAGEPNSSKESFSAKPTAGPNGDASSALNSSRPTLTQLPSNGTTAAPLPKRFSAVNISKKFLEKNSSPATNSMASSSSSQAKSGGSAARPSVQSSYPHSKLVTAKLTAAPQPSTTTGPGWSRPSSVAPGLQPTTTPNGVSVQASSSSQLKGPATSTHGPPQLPHAGTVIQPQPRAASQISQTDGMTSGKSVWGNLRSSASLPSGVRAQSEFPTAAEVAQVSRKPKGMDAKEPTEASAAHKQARLEEADTFRGVHLDPNAHHWDEMEEDDDNFLDGVIEFGDGRQYKVDTAETPPTPAANGPGDLSQTSARREHESASILVPNFPVRKEERFADDFDRSWPKSSPSLSSTGAPYSGPSGGSIASPTSPGSTIHVSQSGQEGGRVLFNERSNKLEPYSSSHRQGPNSYPSKKGYSDAPVPDAKTSRDASTSSNSNVQLLQKSGERGRTHMGIPGSGSFDRQRDYSRRDGPGIGHVPPSPRSAFSQPGSVNGNEIRGRRMSNMGPPPLPGSVSRDFGQRQSAPHYPPHSYNAGQGGMPPRYPPGPPSSSSAASVRHPSQSPVLSHTSSTVVLPNVEATAAQLTGPDIDELRKDVMQNAAARAKQRRQQEEEEREKEKERARRKAAELANEIKPKTVSEPIKEQEVIAVIEDAIRSVDIAAPSTDSTKPSTSEKTQLQRPPSLKGQDRTRLPASRRLSIPSSASGPAPAALTTSWRSHATPLPLPPVPPRVAGSRNVQTTQDHGSPFVSALEHVQILAEDPEADLEVVEFSDMGKFVGVPDSLEPKNDQSRPPPSKPSRPVASDFFDGPSDWDTSPMADVDTWRRRGSREEKDAKDAAGPSTQPRPPTPTPTPMTQQVHPAPSEITPPAESVSAQTSPSRPSKYQSTYNQATMSALDDAMSRIKGALDVMQASDKDVSVQPPLEPGTEPEPKRPSPPVRATSPSSSKTVKDRWLPPALRLRHFDVETRENFHSTAPEPPRSPKPAWNTCTVKLPKTSIAREAISRKQLAQLNRVFPVRWDILSFDPPVDGMSRRDFTVIDVLYRKPYASKGKNKFKVALPKTGAHLQMSRENSNHLGSKGNGAGAFGKPTMADGASTWRKPGSSPLPTNAPPEPSIVPQSEPPLANSSSHAPSSVKGDIPRTKSQPKMPAGTSVAFYRDSQVVDADIDVKPLVNFIVTSELEEPRLSPKDGSMTETARAPSNDSRPDGLKNAPVEQLISRTDPAPTLSSSLIQTGKSSDDSSDPPPIAPPSQSSNTWSRPSLNMSGRGPDPEHLKAVWLQTSNMAELHPVNSLEGIADDPVPFTLQDVKSEDGATPPPTTSSGPSRMSLHDVTRAFQQVPSTSGSTNHKLTISPPTTSAPVARPAPNFGYAMPLPTSNQNMRAPYPPYGSPMMSHSPAPVVYPHPITNSPVPSRMQVSGQYGQPAVWMPLPPPATTQAHGAMMRPVPSPYTPQLMPMAYSPNAQPMYLPAVPNMQSPPQQNSASNRGRSMSMMMSPGIPHASPNMYGSPVMMASPARNQMRNDNSQAHPPPTHHPPTSAYVPAPSTSFMRQW